MIEGVIFDMDGVLLDNARYHILAWQSLGKEFGTALAAESVRRVGGRVRGSRGGRDYDNLRGGGDNHIARLWCRKLPGNCLAGELA